MSSAHSIAWHLTTISPPIAAASNGVTGPIPATLRRAPPKPPIAPAPVTGNPSALGRAEGPTDLQPDGNILDELTVHDATDPALVLTNVKNHAPEDWAADTGAPQSTEADAPSHKR
jgi:hypothetical protein